MWTCNRLDLQTLGSQPVMPKNLPNQWCDSLRASKQPRLRSLPSIDFSSHQVWHVIMTWCSNRKHDLSFLYYNFKGGPMCALEACTRALVGAQGLSVLITKWYTCKARLGPLFALAIGWKLLCPNLRAKVMWRSRLLYWVSCMNF